MDKLSNASQFLDLGGLDSLRSKAQNNESSALKEVAQQFEGIFVQMLMKSMRDANAVFESDSPMNSQYTKFYEQMHDQQMSVNLSAEGMLGLADVMVQQLSPETSQVVPASVLRGNIHFMSQTHQLGQTAMPKQQESLISQKSDKGDLAQQTVQNSVQPSAQPSINSAQNIQGILAGKLSPSAPLSSAQPLSTQAAFVSELYPYATKAAKQLGTTPEVLIAQSALETGWGQKMVRSQGGESSHNLFNIKADSRWKGGQAAAKTTEFEQGVAVKQVANFRAYDGIKQSFDDFVGFISNSARYQQAREHAANPETFIRELQKAGYATDPNYADKVIQVMKSITRDFKDTLQGGL